MMRRTDKDLSEQRERMWCKACGTVTREGICDCNNWPGDRDMHREPNFVNYADAMQEERDQLREQLVKAKASLKKETVRLCLEKTIRLRLKSDPESGEIYSACVSNIEEIVDAILSLTDDLRGQSSKETSASGKSND